MSNIRLQVTDPRSAGYNSGLTPEEVVGLGGGAKGFQGVQGPPGAPGVQGLIGPQGLQGDPGGAQGHQGRDGAQGFRGHRGDPGVGFAGSQGHQGHSGSQGLQGLQGPPGGGGASVLFEYDGVVEQAVRHNLGTFDLIISVWFVGKDSQYLVPCVVRLIDPHTAIPVLLPDAQRGTYRLNAVRTN